ncbi:MAG TPA: peptidylprolyl isomerase [Candidatus Nanoarchaeia archaeon]|nr:peptidylprolyl isomerase [Candidatus Nanoarchaeia archaeon]
MAKHKKEASQLKKEETKTLQFIVGGVVILAIALLALLFHQSQPATPEKAEDNMVAKVNDQVILQSQLDTQYSKLPAQFQQVLTKEQVLSQMIDEALLLQNAKELGIEISDQDVQKKLDEFLQQNGVDQRVLEESLSRQGISQQEVNELFRKQLTIQQLLEKKLGKELEVSDKEIVDYYNDNIQDYKVPPSTKVRHILIAFGNLTEKETEEKAQDVRDMIKPDSSNFCELVQDYSTDTGSVKTCGEYVYTADTQFVPEFKAAGDKQGVNQISVVKTQFGYHIIQTLAKLPERLPKLQDVRSDITNILKAQKQRTALKKYLEELRKVAKIENTLALKSEAGVVEEKAAPIETTPEPTQPKKQTTQEAATPTAPKSLNTFALCLAKKATLYGAKTDAETQKQLKLFGGASSYLNFVDCSYLGNPNVVKKECTQKSIVTFPTWIINGAKTEGVRSLQQLTDASGC